MNIKHLLNRYNWYRQVKDGEIYGVYENQDLYPIILQIYPDKKGVKITCTISRNGVDLFSLEIVNALRDCKRIVYKIIELHELSLQRECSNKPTGKVVVLRD
ncbi:MAG: hypothetical protein GY853_14500 [PVC group bacterium]|nr:hypothetical protein [PVC group bacterium]